MVRGLLLLIFGLIMFAMPSFSQISIDENWQYSYFENFSLMYLEDSVENLGSKDVWQKTFEPFDAEKTKGQQLRLWIKTTIKNSKNQVEDIYIGTSKYEEIQLWLLEGDSLIGPIRNGQSVALDQKPVRIAGLNFFTFAVPANSSKSILLLCENKNASTLPQLEFPLIATTKQYFVSNYEKPGDYTYLFLGGVIIMFIFNLLLFFSTKVRLYLFVAGYILTISIFCLGLIPQFAFPLFGHMDINRIPINWGGTVAAMFYILVASETMELKQNYPRAHKFLMALFWGYVLAILVSFIPNSSAITSAINFGVAFLLFPSVFVISTIRVFSKHSPSKFFFAAIFIYSLGVMVLLLSLTRVLPQVIYGIPAVTYYQLGIITELAFFSLGIGHRINQFEKEKNERIIEKLRADQLVKEKEQTRNLLLNTLPESAVEELMSNGKVVPRLFKEVTILFMDIVGFTKHVEKLDPEALISELDFYYKNFDKIIEKHRIEKIKTIGDAYLAICGIPEATETHAKQVVLAALEILEFVQKQGKEKEHLGFNLRVGIHSGSAIAGLVGVTKFAYDIWGDSVNVAARMEQNSEPGRINVSEATYALVKEDFHCEYRGKIEAKNKGKIDMYWLYPSSV